MNRKSILFFLSFLYSLNASAQVTGGVSSFDFIQQSTNPRVLGVGGENISLKDQDQNLVLNNPALLNEEMAQHASINFVPYFSDIWSSTINYTFDSKKIGLCHIGFQYFNYGEFDSYDENESFLGTFNAKDYAFIVSKSHSVDHYSIGASLKFVGSSIASYHASAILFDIGGTFTHPKKDITIGMAIKNAGIVLSNFSSSSESTTPFDIQIGTSFKPEHMPIRFSITTHHLHQFDISFFDPESNVELDASGNEVEADEPGIGDKIMRHFIVGTEFIFSDNFQLRFGYNVLRRKELRLENVSGGAGFSVGAMMKVKKFEFAFTRAFYHTAGGVTSLGISRNLKSIIKTK